VYCNVETVPKCSTLETPKSTVAHYLRDVLLVISGSLNPFMFSETKI
jgi:hypothetical protein